MSEKKYRYLMKIAFITFQQTNDINNWSGTVHYIYKMLQTRYGHITVFDSIEKNHELLALPLKIYNKILNRSIEYQRNPYFLKRICRDLNRHISNRKFDIVFSPGSLPFAYLETDAAKVFWTDATFHQMLDYYPEYSGLPKSAVSWGNMHEKLALNNADLAFYTSEWARNSAVSDYGIPEEKLVVLPFGANIDEKLEPDEVHQLIRKRTSDPVIRLLSIGSDWHRKGFDFTISIAKELHDRGEKVKLSIVGIRPPRKLNLPFDFQCHGRLDKSNAQDKRTLIRLFKESHFFLLPSKNECLAVVFAEASNFALPSITRNTGGITSMVSHGRNGYVLDYDASANEYVTLIANTFKNRNAYAALCQSSYEVYNEKLNWEKIAVNFDRHISKLLKTGS